MRTKENSEMLTISEAAERLGVSAPTMRVLCASGQIPGVVAIVRRERGRRSFYRIMRNQFEDWIAGNQGGVNNATTTSN